VAINIKTINAIKMDDVERAIICVFNQEVKNSNPQLYQSANQYLEQLCNNSSVVWKVCMEKAMKNQSRGEVIFWCFQTLTQHVILKPQVLQSLSLQEIQSIQQAFITYIKEVIAKDATLQQYIINKFVECLVQLYRVSYLGEWKDFWKHIQYVLIQGGDNESQKERIVDVYLRILDVIDEKIVCRAVERPREEQQYNTRIKDQMKDDCIPDVVNTWITILASRHPILTRKCLSTMTNYIDWIDIHLVANELFMKYIFAYVGVPEFRNEACDCLTVIVSKGMDAMKKWQLLLQLQLPSIKNLYVNSEEDETFALKIAHLANAISLQLLSIYDTFQTATPKNEELAQQIYNALQQFLPFIFKVFGDNDDDVSSQVTEFITAHIHRLKKKLQTGALSDIEHKELEIILQLVTKKAKFNEDFIFEPLKQQEYERDFLLYRLDMFTIFKNVARVAPTISKQFVEFELTNVLNIFRENSSRLVFWDYEVALTLFYHLGEAFPREANDPTIDSGYFRKLLSDIIMSGISFYGHESVQLVYFEILIRYGNLLTVQQQLIVPVLESFVDQRGMRNTNTTVQSRTTFLFLKLVKILEKQLCAFAEKLYDFLSEFLRVELHGEGDILGDSKLFLYEALGSILSHDQVLPQTRIAILQKMLKPILPRMEQIINQQLYKNETPDKPIFSQLLAEQILVIGTICKGLATHKTPPIETRDIFKHVLLNFIVNILKAIPDNRIVTEKIIFYLHIMVNVLGDDAVEVFPAILSQLYSVANEIHQMKEIIILLNQLMTKKQAAVFNIANEMFMPIVTKVFTMIDNGKYDQQSITVSEETRQKSELHKLYFVLIDSILQYNLANVLTSPKNISSMDLVLDTIIHGCNHLNPHIIRVSFNTLQHAIAAYGGNNNNNNNNNAQLQQHHHQFVFTKAIQICFSVPLKSGFELQDGTYNGLLGEIIQTLRVIQGKYHSDFDSFMINQFLPQAMQMNSQESNALVTSLQSKNDKEVRREFRNLFMSRKR
jgi:exportin-T